MIKLIDIIKTTPGLEYHLKHKLPISENIYRYSSEAFVNLFGEARELWKTGMLELPLADVELLETTDIGEWATYEGRKVPLDLPMILESSLEDEIANEEFGMDYDQLGSAEQEWVRDEIDNINYRSDSNIQENPRTNTQTVDLYFENEALLKRFKRTPTFSKLLHPSQLNTLKVGHNKITVNGYILNNLENFSNLGIYKFTRTLKESSTYKGRKVELNKPSRSSRPKKYQVYVKNDKGNVIKVNFGDQTGGLSAKIADSDARQAFSARHNCEDKKDKTKPGYWACRLPRYWKSLGGDKNYSGYW